MVLTLSSSNPFMAKSALSPPRSNSGKRIPDEGLAALREGMGRMDITSRGGSVDLGASTASSKDNKEGSGREVCYTILKVNH
jgi:cell division cycle protein 20 (cofactor of APC complex)